MNTQLTIKNFRIFDETGATVDLKPITILTGCNSSGKSSVVKAAMMLSEFWKQQKDKVNLYGEDVNSRKGVNIDFTKYPFNLLGKIDNVLHNGSQSKTIVFEYTVYSYLISKEVTVKLQFAAGENDRVGKAHLQNIEMTTEDGVILWQEREEGEAEEILLWKASDEEQSEEEQSDVEQSDVEHSGKKVKYVETFSFVNMLLFKEQFFEFLTLGSIYKKYEDMRLNYCIGGEKEKIEFNDGVEILKENLKKCPCDDEKRIKDIKNVASNFYKFDNKKLSFIKGNLSENIEIAEKARETGFLFYVPILDQIGAMSKEIFSAFVSDNDLFSDEEGQAVINEFMSSDSETFGDFYKAKENHYTSSYLLSMEKSDMMDPNGFFATRIYQVLLMWNERLFPNDNKYYYQKLVAYPNESMNVSRLEDCIVNFIWGVVKECLCPSNSNISYVSSSRATINRQYQLGKNDDFTFILKQYMASKHLGSFINKWIKRFGIGESVSFEMDDDGVGVKIRIHKTPEDEKGRLLADEGYGITQLLSIMLQIEMTSRSIFDNDKYYTTIAVEEPEIHLHPKYQSLLADMFVEAYKEKKINFLIETHSEYLIRRMQLLVAGVDADLKLDKNDVSISYIYTKEEAEKENQPLVKNISICEDGYLNDTFGSGFFDEASNLSHKLLNINVN